MPPKLQAALNTESNAPPSLLHQAELFPDIHMFSVLLDVFYQQPLLDAMIEFRRQRALPFPPEIREEYIQVKVSNPKG